jgi:hypothetical protein
MIKLIIKFFEPLLEAWKEAKYIDNVERVEIRCGTLESYEVLDD